MRDLRDFYERNNATSADSFPTSSSDPRHQALDYRSDDPAILALSLPEIPGVGSSVTSYRACWSWPSRRFG